MMLQIALRTSTAATAVQMVISKHLEWCTVCGIAQSGRGTECRLRGSPRTSSGQQCIRQIPATAASASGPADLRSQNDALHDWRQLPLPLHERPAQHVCQLTDLRVWHQQAKQQAQQTNDAFAADNGPSSSDLQRELDWVLDDAVAAVQHSADSIWRDTCWRALESEHRRSAAAAVRQWRVSLRASLSDLQELWQVRLEDRCPMQYLTNCAHWWRFQLAVGPGVLIPRPETEQLLDLAGAALDARPQLRDGHWADLGTGSGAIALGLASILPASSQVHAVDASPQAAAWAQLNVHRVPHDANMQVSMGSWFEPLQHLRGQLAGVVSNPPYIPAGNMSTLQAEVGRHEPWSALNGGAGPGCDSLTAICHGATDMLAPGGFLALETNGGQQAHDVAVMVRGATVSSQPVFADVAVVADIFGVDRFVTANRC